MENSTTLLLYLPRDFWFSYNMYHESEEILTEWKITNEKYDSIFTDNETHMMKAKGS